MTRRRDAAATRAAILASAREVFARAGYDGAGVREIAARAGVTAMLVNRYFGSKEGLFSEVLASTMREPTVLADEVLASHDPPLAMARALVSITGAADEPTIGFRILTRSTSSTRAAELGRARIARHHHATLAALVTGDRAEERAGVVLALVLGLQGMRQTLALPALADADPDDLVAVLTPLLRELLGRG